MHTSAPIIQRQLLERLINVSSNTEIGRTYRFNQIKTVDDFNSAIPIVTYEDLFPYIRRMMDGAPDILYPGVMRYFAKSSGTSNDRSKYIPVSDTMIDDNFICSSWDSMCMAYHQRPDSRMFADKSLLIGGALEDVEGGNGIRTGDVSAIMLNEMPSIGRPFYTPDFETAIMTDFESKIEKIAHITSSEKVTMFGGVPTWIIVLFNRILEITGASHMEEVWPNARLYMHGGVGFAPYKKQFQSYFPSGNLDFMEVYNASEGYIGLQDNYEDDSLLLMADNGIYYEFVPLSDYPSNNALPLSSVEIGQTYVIVMTTCAGLWRYVPGDTIQFTSIAPYRLKVVGRTSQYINVFGEELMVHNADEAVSTVAALHQAPISNYTVAPIMMDKQQQGGHQWLIEFEQAPKNLDVFAVDLDNTLKTLNSDYNAKRLKDMALKNLEITPLPKGSFDKWLKSKGKMGSQIKIPRLSNDRTYVDEIIALLQ